MADTTYPYMNSVKNLPEILARIKNAGAPPRFTFEFLKSNLGFGSSRDRTIISVLKKLGFLSADGTPTARYNEYRSDATSGAAMAAGLRDGWADIFLSDQRAFEKSTAQLVGVFKSVTGAGDAVAQKMATTFKTLASSADWLHSSAKAVVDEAGTEELTELPPPRTGVISLKHDVHIHLPPTSDIAVYTAIFRALRDELLG